MDHSLQGQSCPHACLPARERYIDQAFINANCETTQMSCKSVFKRYEGLTSWLSSWFHPPTLQHYRKGSSELSASSSADCLHSTKQDTHMQMQFKYHVCMKYVHWQTPRPICSSARCQQPHVPWAFRWFCSTGSRKTGSCVLSCVFFPPFTWKPLSATNSRRMSLVPSKILKIRRSLNTLSTPASCKNNMLYSEDETGKVPQKYIYSVTLYFKVKKLHVVITVSYA